MYTKNDMKQLRHRRMKQEEVERQVENFKHGFAPVLVEKAATIGDGIHEMTQEEKETHAKYFESRMQDVDMVKFVPASGSATRMFKTLNAFRASYTGSDEDYLNYLQDKEPGTMYSFFAKLKEYPFYHHLKAALHQDHLDLDKLLWKNRFLEILDYLLTEKGLNYNHTPKALIDFHIYKDHVRKAIEEHLVEAALYCHNGQQAKLHFTVSEEYLPRVKAFVKEAVKAYKKEYGLTFDVSFSIQKPSTDTVSLTSKGELLRDAEGNIIFRPGGHGALIHNLNDLKEHLIFIKNIDNVTPDRNKADTVLYKKILAGILLEIQQQVFNYMKLLDKPRNLTPALVDEIRTFIHEKLGCIPAPETFPTNAREQVKYLRNILDRPLRVCGMVRNEGEPGGGPFWVNIPGEGQRLMIVESAQIDLKNREQRKIFESSTHFNPVDIVCSPYNYKGKKYDLSDFIDHTQGFITEKSHEGSTIKVQELPGLWNGAMARWNTLFVEVPLSTFSPVKTVFDLLRFEHRNVFKID